MPRCPVCHVEVDLERSPGSPFCSDRCRLVDLGRWLDESYGVPVPDRSGEDSDDDAEGAGEGTGDLAD
jgi:endogenous inhibitor of DNA gyrase (YacG/DUF329 family)